MKTHRGTISIALTSVALMILGLTGCSSQHALETATASHSQKSVAEPAPKPTPTPTPTDLTGDWRQSNSSSADSYQAATITATTIEINWVTDNGDTKSLYWAGTYQPPTTPSATFSWDSANDTAQTSVALLASSDPTKKFTYNNGTISYSVSALGTTTTVQLKHK